MAIKRPDLYEHQNSNLPIVDGDNVIGAPRVVADRAALYALATQSAKLRQDVTVVRVKSENADLLLVDATKIGQAAGWQVKTSGSGGGGVVIGNVDPDTLDPIPITQDGPQDIPIPAGYIGGLIEIQDVGRPTNQRRSLKGLYTTSADRTKWSFSTGADLKDGSFLHISPLLPSATGPGGDVTKAYVDSQDAKKVEYWQAGQSVKAGVLYFVANGFAGPGFYSPKNDIGTSNVVNSTLYTFEAGVTTADINAALAAAPNPNGTDRRFALLSDLGLLGFLRSGTSTGAGNSIFGPFDNGCDIAGQASYCRMDGGFNNLITSNPSDPVQGRGAGYGNTIDNGADNTISGCSVIRMTDCQLCEVSASDNCILDHSSGILLTNCQNIRLDDCNDLTLDGRSNETYVRNVLQVPPVGGAVPFGPFTATGTPGETFPCPNVQVADNVLILDAQADEEADEPVPVIRFKRDGTPRFSVLSPGTEQARLSFMAGPKKPQLGDLLTFVGYGSAGLGGGAPSVPDYTSINTIVAGTSIFTDVYAPFDAPFRAELANRYTANSKEGGVTSHSLSAVAGQRITTGNGVGTVGMTDDLPNQVYQFLVAGTLNLLVIDGPTNEAAARVIYGNDLTRTTPNPVPLTAQQAAQATFDAFNGMLGTIKAYATANNFTLGIITGSLAPRYQPEVPQPLFENTRLAYNQLLTTALGNGTANFNKRAWVGEDYRSTTPPPNADGSPSTYYGDSVHPNANGRDTIWVPLYADAAASYLFGVAQPAPVLGVDPGGPVQLTGLGVPARPFFAVDGPSGIAYDGTQVTTQLTDPAEFTYSSRAVFGGVFPANGNFMMIQRYSAGSGDAIVMAGQNNILETYREALNGVYVPRNYGGLAYTQQGVDQGLELSPVLNPLPADTWYCLCREIIGGQAEWSVRTSTNSGSTWVKRHIITTNGYAGICYPKVNLAGGGICVNPRTIGLV